VATVTIPVTKNRSSQPRLAKNGKVVAVAEETVNVETSDNDAKRIERAKASGAVFSPQEDSAKDETDNEVTYNWLKVSFPDAKSALAYFDGNEKDLLEACARSVNTNRKQNARQGALADAVPDAVKKMIQAAKRLAASEDANWGTDVDRILAFLKDPTVYGGKLPGMAA
jgi:hypothetical protein